MGFSYHGEFDPSSGRTLAAGLTHASRTRTFWLRPGQVQWRTGAYRVDNLPLGAGQSRETVANTARRLGPAWGPDESLGLPRRLGMGLRWISLLVRQRLTKATIHSWSERTISHTGTETRPRLLREAAVGNLAQWGHP